MKKRRKIFMFRRLRRFGGAGLYGHSNGLHNEPTSGKTAENNKQNLNIAQNGPRPVMLVLCVVESCSSVTFDVIRCCTRQRTFYFLLEQSHLYNKLRCSLIVCFAARFLCLSGALLGFHASVSRIHTLLAAHISSFLSASPLARPVPC